MVRLGKELDRVEVINSSTGEWEFPYLTDGDGLDLSGPTGHHSGGETHGCQGFTYMSDTNLMTNPPKFRFRKETYHVNYKDHPDIFKYILGGLICDKCLSIKMGYSFLLSY
jgi:hypothetical protein